MARKRALIRRPESVSRPLPDYMVDILGRRYPVTDMVQASVRVEAFRDQTGMRASQMGSRFLIFDKTNAVIGYVTYNGRVWAGKPEDALSNQVHLVYDPSEPAHRAAYSAPTAITPSRVIRNNPDLIYTVLYEDGGFVTSFSDKAEAKRFVKEHNEDQMRDPNTMEYRLVVQRRPSRR
jgi:hypothetical protein